MHASGITTSSRPALQLVLVIGTPGTGKTTLARRMAHRLGCPLIEKDHVSDPLFRRGMADLAHKSLAYETICNFASSVLRTCDRVIVEAPLKKQLASWKPGEEHPFDQFRRIADDAGAQFLVVHASCPEDLVRQRMISRAHPRDDAKLVDEHSFARFLADEQIALDPATVTGYTLLPVDTSNSVAADQAIVWVVTHAAIRGPSGPLHTSRPPIGLRGLIAR